LRHAYTANVEIAFQKEPEFRARRLMKISHAGAAYPLAPACLGIIGVVSGAAHPC
jgi:hypothetical protein